MAILKHIASKNASYRDAFNYLVYQHNEFTQKPILDENGRPQLREEYYIDGILCRPEGFAKACNKTNKQFNKNQKKGEIKSHHYIISFDPRDKEENGLSAKEAQRMGMNFASQNFPGHQALVCTHADGHNGSGNIHVHIVINSVRAENVERQDFMERLCDSKAGNKHHLTKDYLKHLKQQVMTMCQNRQLYQVDLLNPAHDKVTEQEYHAERRGQQKLDERNAEIIAAGLKPRNTKFETQKEVLRKQITEIAEKSKSFPEFEKALMGKYGIAVNDKRGRYSYKLPDREKPISARMLGAAYDREYLLALFADNAKGIKRENTNRDRTAEKVQKPFTAPYHTEEIPKSAKYEKSGIRLVVDLENCIKAQQSRAYAQKVKISNLQQMADTYAFVKSHGYASVEELETALNDAKARASAAKNHLKATESRLSDVNKQIRLTGQYLANKDIYAEYRQSKKSEEFYEKYRAAITLYETARDTLRAMSGGQKLPSMKSLKAEKENLVASKNAEYEAYQNARTEQRDLQTIYTNVRKMLGMEDGRTTKREQRQEIT
jgi:hypothetical protein